MKKNKKPMFAFLSFLVIFVLLLETVSLIMIPKDMDTRRIIRGLDEEKKNSLDLLFLGDSSLYRSIIPAKLWKEQGITSYVLGAPALRPYAAYYLLKDALKKQTPSAVVFEVNCAFNTHKYGMGNKRKVIDNMKLNSSKWEMINDPAFHFSLKEKLSLLFPIFMYHNRYNELSGDDVIKTFVDQKDSMKGYVISGKRKPYRGKKDYMKASNSFIFEENSEKYLTKIAQLCAEKRIPLILLKVPGAREWNHQKQQLIETYASQKQLPYYDLNEAMAKEIDWSLDTSDKGVHLNVFGAEKVTHEVGNYLKKKYVLSRTTDSLVIDSYEKAVQEFEKRKKKILESSHSLVDKQAGQRV